MKGTPGEGETRPERENWTAGLDLGGLIEGPVTGFQEVRREGLRLAPLQRDTKILEEELAERPNDPFVLFNLGSIAVERQD